MLTTILLLILILILSGSLPVWPYSRRWGFRGSGLIGLLLIILIYLANPKTFKNEITPGDSGNIIYHLTS